MFSRGNPILIWNEIREQEAQWHCGICVNTEQDWLIDNTSNMFDKLKLLLESRFAKQGNQCQSNFLAISTYQVSNASTKTEHIIM